MRLFTALWPDATANDDVDARMAVAGLEDGWRPTPSARRHVTLCFHGEAEPSVLVARLHAADLGPAAGLRVRCHGAGMFGPALWLGVEADDPGRMATLVAAAGADPATHVGHLTVAWWRDRGERPDLPAGLPTGPGPWWPVEAVDLVASGTPYRTLDRVGLG